MLWQGFHVDEFDRMVFEGARIHVAGGGKGGFNHRFAQTTHHPSDLEGNSMPADHPPFNFLPEGSPPDNDVLVEAKRLDAIPKIIMTNNTLEYWTRSASLVSTDPTGTRDAPFHPNVRYFMTNGAPHGGAASRTPTVTEHGRNPLGVANVQRAMLVNLDRWVGEEYRATSQPLSDHRRWRADHSRRARRTFPEDPGNASPRAQPPATTGRLRPGFLDRWRVHDRAAENGRTVPDPGPRLRCGWKRPRRHSAAGARGAARDIPGLEPPRDAIRVARLSDPVSTDRSGRFEATELDREMIGDPRPSVESRYPDRGQYVAQVREAVRRLVTDRILLAEDGDTYVEQAEGLAWPPAPIDGFPFWRLVPSTESVEMPVAVPVF